mgnify:CR=1 FL=1
MAQDPINEKKVNTTPSTQGPDFTPVRGEVGGANALSPNDQVGPNFAGVGTGSQVPGERAITRPAPQPNFGGVATGSQVPGSRAITAPAPQPNFTGVGTGSQVPGDSAILPSDQIGPNFSTPTGTGPDESIGAVDGTPGITTGSIDVSANQKAFSEDWRFKVGLMPGSDVLYKDGDQYSILAPLIKTDGVIFPYTPNVLVNYRANYDKVSPTHSNYPSYFYQSSEISDVQINATFTAQSTEEADYLMAVIHFFKSASKMFYGQDKNKGTPPPLLSVTGFGPDQFNYHKAVVSQFNYSLPDNVDYIRTSVAGYGSIEAQQTRARLNGGSGNYGMFGIASRIGRLFGIGANVGAESDFQTANEGTNLAKSGATYVPTKIEVSIILLPIVTREEQSKQFSLKDYANGQGLSQRGQW